MTTRSRHPTAAEANGSQPQTEKQPTAAASITVILMVLIAVIVPFGWTVTAARLRGSRHGMAALAATVTKRLLPRPLVMYPAFSQQNYTNTLTAATSTG